MPTEESPTPTQPTSEGHRERLRARFLAGEEAALTDEALLELLLVYAIPRRDVKPLAQSLLARFGTIAAVLAADPADLKRVSGIKENSVVLLKLAAHLSGEKAAPLVAPPVDESADGEPAELAIESAPNNRSVQESKVAERPDAKKSSEQAKLQVSNGYSLDAAQNARLLSYILERPAVRKFARRDMMEGTGLSEGQTESLASIGAAVGLVAPRTTVLTPFGKLVAAHDLFLDSLITLEFCHFLGAGNPRNLIWFMVFNELLVTQKPTDQSGWSAWLRDKLAGQYSPRSLVKHVAHEVRFLLDAYTVKNFKKLNLLAETLEKTIALRRYTALQPHTLAAMIYLVGQQHQARLVSFSDLHAEPGSPGRVFGIDSTTMRQMVETLHQKAWIRFEVRHGLDQIRLLDGFTHLEFLAAAYETRPPQASATPGQPEEEHLLL
jgi:hypothetical protein